jgi:hypothetical protein
MQDEALSSAGILSLRSGAASVALAPAIGGSIASFRWSLEGRTIDWLRPAPEPALRSGAVEETSCFPLIPCAFSLQASGSKPPFDSSPRSMLCNT